MKTPAPENKKEKKLGLSGADDGPTRGREEERKREYTAIIIIL